MERLKNSHWITSENLQTKPRGMYRISDSGASTRPNFAYMIFRNLSSLNFDRIGTAIFKFAVFSIILYDHIGITKSIWLVILGAIIIEYTQSHR